MTSQLTTFTKRVCCSTLGISSFNQLSTKPIVKKKYMVKWILHSTGHFVLTKKHCSGMEWGPSGVNLLSPVMNSVNLLRTVYTHTHPNGANNAKVSRLLLGSTQAAELSEPLPYTTVNDALWDEIRCRQTGAGEKRTRRAGRLRLGQWEASACGRGAVTLSVGAAAAAASSREAPS